MTAANLTRFGTGTGTYRCGVCDRTTTEEALASFCGGASGVDTDREWQSTTLCSPCARTEVRDCTAAEDAYYAEMDNS